MLVADLAAQSGIPKAFLDQILLELKRRGILQSRKGRGGGYMLGRPADAITFGEIVRTLEGPLAPIGCVSQTAYVPCAECGDEALCGVRMVMKEVRDATAHILDHTSVGSVSRRVARAAAGPRVGAPAPLRRATARRGQAPPAARSTRPRE
jgi:Rrf2 family protein